MQFSDYLAGFPAIDQLAGLNVLDETGTVVHTIPAIEGKLGSLKLYNALAVQFNGKLDAHSAQQGLDYFAEHVADARAQPGKHPNIDLLFRVIAEQKQWQLQPLQK